MTSIERTKDELVAHIRMENAGDGTAKTVGVTGALRADGTILERASTTISYVPAQGLRRAALVFPRHGGEGTVSVTTTGYALP